MATSSRNRLKKIQVTGPVSVERVRGTPEICRVILIMGPTGAGKSTFIEALGLGGLERISSNRLEGFTQTVSTYMMHNVVDKYGNAIYLVDSPGFADTKISELAIVSMLKKWMDDNGGKAFDRILYLTPITHVRFAGSQRQVLKTFQALTGVNTSFDITIVTTMWDSIEGERAIARAERTYNQLESDIWKEFIDEGALIVKFVNSQDSALSALDMALSQASGEYFHLDNKEGPVLQQTPFAPNLYTGLQHRIENLQLEIPNIKSDLEYAEAENDLLLQSVLRPRLEEAEAYLVKFQSELRDFENPPIERSSKDGNQVEDDDDGRYDGDAKRDIDPAHFDCTIPSGHPSPCAPMTVRIRSASESSVVSAVPAVISIPEVTLPPGATVYRPPARPSDSPFQPHVAAAEEMLAHGQLPRKRLARLSRALDIIMGCGCCDKGVQVNHDI